MHSFAYRIGLPFILVTQLAAGCASGNDGEPTNNVDPVSTPGAAGGSVAGGGLTPIPPSMGGSTVVSPFDAGIAGPPTGIPTPPPNADRPYDAGASREAGPVTGSSGETGDASGSVSAPASSSAPIMRGNDPTSASASAKGPYQVMTYTTGFPVNLYGGGTIHYPTDATPPFGAVAVCPGFVAAQSSIQSWGPFLASHGIVTITIDTLTPLDVVDQRADELMDALASIKSENARSGGPLFNKIDTMRMGVMGWSMGGGGTWLAASMHSELRSAVSFAGHIATALNQDVTTNKVPTLLLAGSADNLILGGGMSQPVYDEIPESTPKMVWEVAGAGHDVANSPSNSGGAIGRYGLSWQKVFLEGDVRYRKFLLEMAPNASYFKTNVK
jgi:dienelactone hydrolase